MGDVLAGIWARINEEPVLTLGLVQAGTLLAVGFGLKLTAEQIALVGAFTAALLAFIARRQVTPV
jgi:hypothetical protein